MIFCIKEGCMNKYIIFYMIFACCSFFSFSFHESLGFNLNELPIADIILDKVLEKTIIELRKKYPLSIIGVGGSQKDKKKTEIDVSFMLNRSLSKDECRELLIDIAEELLKQINEDKDLQPHLYYTPFSYKNLEIRVFLRNPDRSSIEYPHIFMFSLIGTIEYDVRYPNVTYGYTREEETYDKALQIVQAQRSERAMTLASEPAHIPVPQPTEQTFFQRVCQKFYDFFK